MEKVLGNAVKSLNEPNLVAVFVGIVLGLALGAIPFAVPGVSKAVLEVVAQDTLTVKLLPTSGNIPIQGVAESGDLLYDSGITCVGKSNYPATRRHDTKKEKSIFYKSLGWLTAL